MSTIARASKVLDALAATGRPCRFAELGRATALPSATLHRLLVALVRTGLVEQEQHTGLYRLGVRLAELSHAALKSLSLGDLALPTMQRLVSETGESCYLARLARDPRMVTYIEAVYSEQLLSVTSYTGRMSPAHCTATGKVLLAYAPEAVRRRVLSSRLEVRTARTIADAVALARELDRVRERGYAITQREYSDEITSVAAPVANRFGVVDTTVAVCGPSSRLRDGTLARAIRAVVRGADEISVQLKTGTHLIPDASASPA